MVRYLLARGIGNESLDPILPSGNLTQTQLDSLCSTYISGYKAWIGKYMELLHGEVSEAVYEWHLFASKLAEAKLALKDAEKAEENRVRLLDN